MCQGCNTETQGEVPLVLACAYPDEYHLMEEKDRESVRMSADLCLISGKTPKHFVRGLLEMPLLLQGISDSSAFVLTWSLWVAVSQVDFDEIVAAWSQPEVLTKSGTLANKLPTYSGSTGTSAILTTRGGLRPLINLSKAADTALFEHHAKGIPKEELAATLNTVFAERSR